LLGNAIKFTEKGSIILRVGLEQGNSNNAELSTQEASPLSLKTNPQTYTLYFEVEDTGVGIAPEEIDTLFAAFVQTESGRKSAEGTGLGLSITRRFVQLMGGNITVSSVLGKGTIFKMKIKVSPAQTSEIISESSYRVVGLESGQSPWRILVVDDNQENRLLLVKLLQPIGFEMQEAENGEQAVNLWESWQPHLIWMDTRMPVMDGLQATIKIRTKENERRLIREIGSITNRESASLNPIFCVPQTAIIALTASTFEEKREEILSIGCDDFVRKPFQEQVIFDKIAQFLKVLYIYEDLPQGTSNFSRKRYSINQRPDSFFLPLLAQVPKSWVAELHQAANELNEEFIFQLIEELPGTSATLADSLRDLLNDFRLDIIVRITS